MENDRRTEKNEQENPSYIRKPWQEPKVEVLPIKETQQDFTAGDDGNGLGGS
jgi:hypothetical protein